MSKRVLEKLHKELSTPNNPSANRLRQKKEIKMDFLVKNLSVLAYANGFTHWHYKTDVDTLRTCLTKNYFREACDMLSVNDVIFLQGSDGTTQAYVIENEPNSIQLSKLK